MAIRLTAALDKISQSAAKIDQKISRNVFAESRINAEAILLEALRAIRPLIIGALNRSLALSGIKRKSGDLSRAVSDPLILIGQGQIKVAFRDGLPEKLYTYANSLNSGAVHAAGLGGRAKRTLKRAAFEGRALSARERRRFEKGVTQKHKDRVIQKGAFDVASAKVIPAKPFFFFSSADKDRIGKEFARQYRDAVKRRATRRVRAAQ